MLLAPHTSHIWQPWHLQANFASRISEDIARNLGYILLAEFITEFESIFSKKSFYETDWKISPNSFDIGQLVYKNFRIIPLV